MADQQPPIDTTAAEAREKHLEPIFGPWALEVVDRAVLSPGEHVLDVGCGTGPATRLAAKQLASSGRVVGLDIDPVRLALARSLTAQERLNIDWFEGSALDLPFEANTFDVALCCLTLQFLPDRNKGLREIHRVLKPGGRLVASVWRSVEHCPGYHAFSEAMSKASGKEPEPMPPFSLGDAEELRTLAKVAGFKDVKVHQTTKISRFASASQFVEAIAAGAATTRRALEAFDGKTRETIGASVAASLQKYTDRDGLGLPMGANILTASI
jgi:ubiquinone/menaquinone biosynthesis C-methylase UbiE